MGQVQNLFVSMHPETSAGFHLHWLECFQSRDGETGPSREADKERPDGVNVEPLSKVLGTGSLRILLFFAEVLDLPHHGWHEREVGERKCGPVSIPEVWFES